MLLLDESDTGSQWEPTSVVDPKEDDRLWETIKFAGGEEGALEQGIQVWAFEPFERLMLKTIAACQPCCVCCACRHLHGREKPPSACVPPLQGASEALQWGMPGDPQGEWWRGSPRRRRSVRKQLLLMKARRAERAGDVGLAAQLFAEAKSRELSNAAAADAMRAELSEYSDLSECPSAAVGSDAEVCQNGPHKVVGKARYTGANVRR